MTVFDFDPAGITEPLAQRDWWLAGGVAALAVAALLFGPRLSGQRADACAIGNGATSVSAGAAPATGSSTDTASCNAAPRRAAAKVG